MSALGRLSVLVEAEIAKFTSDMGKAERAAARASKAIRDNMRRDLQSVERQIESLTKRIESINSTAKRAFVGLSASYAVREITRLADSYTNIQSRLKVVTNGERQLARAMEDTYSIAQRTRSGLESTAALYTRMSQALSGMGASQNKIAQLTETINQSFIVSGASAKEASNAIIQLSQGLAAGALRGEEFNSVAEQAPRLMKAIAQSMGVPIGQLRALAHEGKITAEVLMNALSGEQANAIARDFAKIEVTIGGALTQLRNELLVFIGEAGQTSGASRLIAESIQLVANSMGALIPAVIALGAAWGTKYVTGAVAATVATAKKTHALQLEAAQTLLSARAAEAAALAEVQKQRARAATELQLKALVAAEKAYQIAQMQSAMAAEAVTKAAALNASALSKVGSSLLAMVGGPIGAAVLGVGALVYAFKQLTDAERAREAAFSASIDQLNETAESAAELSERLTDIAQIPPPATDQWAQYAEAVNKVAEQHDVLERKKQELADAEQHLQSLYQRSNADFAIARQLDYIVRLRDEVGRLEPAVKGAQHATEQLGNEIARTFAPANIAAVEAFGAALQGIETDGVVSTVRGIFGAVVAGVDAYRGKVSEMAEANARVREMFSEAAEQSKRAEEQLKTFGKTTSDIYRDHVAQLEELAKVQGWDDERTDAMRAQLDELYKMPLALEAAKEAQKAATEADREAARQKRELERAEREAARAAEEAAQIRQSLADQAADVLAQQSGEDAVAMLEYERTLRDVNERLAELADATQRAGAGAEQLAEAEKHADKIRRGAAATLERELKAIKEKRDVIGRLNRTYSEQLKMLGMTRRELFQYEAAARAVEETLEALGHNATPEILAATAEQASDAAGEFFDAAEEAERLRDILSEFDDIGMGSLVKDIELVKKALEEATDPAQIARLEGALRGLRLSMVESIAGSAATALRGIQQMTDEGSKSFKAMQIAIDALALVQAISAILNQGQGDPYSAPARMAAMAAAIAPLVANLAGSIGSFGGGSGGGAAERQATQGTGSVLGDAEAKSESILRATEITANATRELVGINRSMLQALLSLQDAIAGATVMLARGVANVDLSGINLNTGGFVGSILGRRARISDTGLMIGGGPITGGLNVSAYAESESRSHWFSSTRRTTTTQALPEDAARQFDLIIQDIVDTVREAARAIGIPLDEIEQRIANFNVEAQRISLMDLSAEEAEQELMAVFGQIFDGLAGHVVPFIEQFQRAGEGLGETLVRVATSVQVAQEAFRYLGIAIDESDPERFAQISVALIEAAGGIDEFITGMKAFADAFAPEEFRFETAASELRDAFEQVGLAVPETREEMWALMQSLDATTEEGRRQIAMLLRLADVADDYYRGLERQEDAANRAAQAMSDLNDLISELARDGWSEPTRAVMDLDRQYREHVATIQRLARESGRAEASERELAIARNWHQRQLRKLAAELMKSASDIAAQLGYGIGFAEEERQSSIDTELGGIADVSAAVEDRYARELQLLQELDKYVRSLGISELSPLNPAERLSEAEAEYNRILALAQSGDLDALAQLQGAAQAYLAEAHSFYGGVGAYEDIFNSVRDTLRGIVEAGPQSEQTIPQTPVYGGPVTVEPGEQWAQMNEIERAALAQQLVDYIQALALALGESSLTVMEALGIPLGKLVSDLGIDLQNITSGTVEGLADLALRLGIPLGDLVERLGLSMPELGAGIRQLADEMGYNVNEIVNATGTGLLDLAQYLGVDLRELGEALGIELGEITDVNSPIYRSLMDVIDDLSPEIGDVLKPLLEDVANATTEADARAAVGAVEDAINSMPAGIRDMLAPFFEGVNPAGAMTDLQYLESIDGGIATMIEVLRRIESNTYVPGYAQGTPFVPNTGLALLHKGEAVVPADIAARMRAGEAVTLNSIDSANDDRQGGSMERRIDRLIDLTERMLETENRQLAAMNKPQLPGYRNVA